MKYIIPVEPNMQKARVVLDASKDFQPTKSYVFSVYCTTMDERNTLLPNNFNVIGKLFYSSELECCA